MKQRTCFLCDEPLSYEDYLATNIDLEEFIKYTDFTIKQSFLCKFVFNRKFKKFELVKLWETPFVELLCCHCKKDLKDITESSKSLWQLLEWAKDKRWVKLKELGIIDQVDLIKIKGLKNGD